MGTTIALLMGAGCTEPDTQLVATLMRRSAPVLTVASTDRGPDASGTAIGWHDGHLLVAWAAVNAVSPVPNSMTRDLHLQWWSLDGVPESLDEMVGVMVGYRTNWILEGDALVSPDIGDPLARAPQVWDRDRVWFLRAQFGQPTSWRQVSVRLAAQPNMGFIAVGLSLGTGDGIPGALPATGTSHGVQGLLAGMPGEADCDISQDYQRLMLIDEAALTETVETAASPVCLPTGEEELARAVDTGDPWLFTLDDGSLGAVYRMNIRSLALVYSRIDPITHAITPPVAVGNPPALVAGFAPGGWQPRAAVAPGGRIIFVERFVPEVAWSGARLCVRIGVFDDDGSHAHDAPWQLACRHGGAITEWAELFSVREGVVLVWSERTGPAELVTARAVPDRLATINAVLLTRDGRRGSEILQIVRHDGSDPPEQFGDYEPMIAGEGERVVVGWVDPRGTPGLYVSSFDVVPDGP